MYNRAYYLANQKRMRIYNQEYKRKQKEEKPITEEDLDRIIEWYDNVYYGIQQMSRQYYR